MLLLTCLALWSFSKSALCFVTERSWVMKVNEKERKCQHPCVGRVNGGELRAYTSKHKHPASTRAVFWLDGDTFQTGVWGCHANKQCGWNVLWEKKKKLYVSQTVGVNIMFLMCFVRQSPSWPGDKKGEIREHTFSQGILHWPQMLLCLLLTWIVTFGVFPQTSVN